MQFVAPRIGFVLGKIDTIATGDQNEFAHPSQNDVDPALVVGVRLKVTSRCASVT